MIRFSKNGVSKEIETSSTSSTPQYIKVSKDNVTQFIDLTENISETDVQQFTLKVNNKTYYTKAANKDYIILPNGDWQIFTCVGLSTYRDYCNLSQANMDTNAFLMNDIICESTDLWTTIGINGMAYTGVFDGQGYTINGLHLDGAVTDSESFIRSIGYANGSITGEVKNLKIGNSTITGDSCAFISLSCAENSTIQNIEILANNTVTNVSNFGAVVRSVASDAQLATNLINRADISGTTAIGGIASFLYNATECYNYGNITFTENDIGGISIFGSTLSNCENHGTITITGDSTTAEFVGGIVSRGVNITNCHNYGFVSGNRVVSGIVGYIDSTTTVSLCSNNANITGKSTYVGGILGFTNDENSYFQGCYNTGTITGSSSVGGIVGQMSRETINNCYNTGSIIGESSIGGIAGSMRDGTAMFCYSINANIDTTKTNSGDIYGYGYNSTRYANYFVGNSNQANKLENISQLNTLVDLINEQNSVNGNDRTKQYSYKVGDVTPYAVKEDVPVSTSLTTDADGNFAINSSNGMTLFRDSLTLNKYPTQKAYLTTDVDISNQNWTPFYYTNKANQIFDGQGYTINGLTQTVNKTDITTYFLGFVRMGSFVEPFTIKNINFTNVNINATNTNNNGVDIGVISLGSAYMTIENIHVLNGTINTTTNDYRSQDNIGGIVAYHAINSDIINCSSNIIINATINNHNNTIYPISIGGIAGRLTHNTANIIACSYSGAITIQGSNSLSTNISAGGIVGRIISSTGTNYIIACYNTGNINSNKQVGGIIGINDHANYIVNNLIGCYNTGNLSGAIVDEISLAPITNNVANYYVSDTESSTKGTRVANIEALNNEVPTINDALSVQTVIPDIQYSYKQGDPTTNIPTIINVAPPTPVFNVTSEQTYDATPLGTCYYGNPMMGNMYTEYNVDEEHCMTQEMPTWQETSPNGKVDYTVSAPSVGNWTYDIIIDGVNYTGSVISTATLRTGTVYNKTTITITGTCTPT